MSGGRGLDVSGRGVGGVGIIVTGLMVVEASGGWAVLHGAVVMGMC